MGNVVIINYEARKDGVILETNTPTRLKTGLVRSSTFFVSWDKIGSALLEDYTELQEVAELRALRGEKLE